MPNPKDAFGAQKIPLRFVPWAALVHLAYVMRTGAQKYGWMNWREHAVKRSVYHEAALRHLLSAMDGEDLDPESGEPHEAHVIASLAILLDAKANGKLIDDRPAPGAFGRLVQERTETDSKTIANCALKFNNVVPNKGWRPPGIDVVGDQRTEPV